MVFDKAKPPVKLSDMAKTTQDQVREMKTQGLSYSDIGRELGISKQLAFWHGRAGKGENLCPGCCRLLKKRKAKHNASLSHGDGSATPLHEKS